MFINKKSVKVIRKEFDIKEFIQANGAVSSADVMRQFGISKPTAISLLKESNAIAIGNSVKREYALATICPVR